MDRKAIVFNVCDVRFERSASANDLIWKAFACLKLSIFFNTIRELIWFQNVPHNQHAQMFTSNFTYSRRWMAFTIAPNMANSISSRNSYVTLKTYPIMCRIKVNNLTNPMNFTITLNSIMHKHINNIFFFFGMTLPFRFEWKSHLSCTILCIIIFSINSLLLILCMVHSEVLNFDVKLLKNPCKAKFIAVKWISCTQYG